MVLDLIKRLADKGLAVIVISHNLNDVFEVADRIAVLHLGRLVSSGPIAEYDRQLVVELMTTGTASRSVGEEGTTEASTAAAALTKSYGSSGSGGAVGNGGGDMTSPHEPG